MSASATEMRASLLLTLEDQLSGGLTRLMEVLNRLTGNFGRLNDLTERLNVGAPFDKAARPIGEAGAAIGRVGVDVDRLVGTVDRLHSGTPFKAFRDAVDGADKAVKTFNKNVDGLAPALAKLDLGKPFVSMGRDIEAATSKIGGLEDRLSGFGSTAQAVGRKIDEAMAKSKTLPGGGEMPGALSSLTGGYGWIGAALGIDAGVSAVRKHADYENTLRHIAITERLSGPAVDVEIRRLSELFAADAQHTGQSSESIAKAFSTLVQMGIPITDANRIIGMHSEAATAYNISPEALGPAVGALLQTLKVPDQEIGSALAAMALAAKEGRFKVEDFSLELPGVAGIASATGMHGRGGADYLFAALETVMKNSSQPSNAAANLREAFSNIFSPFAERFFARRTGIDLDRSLLNAEKLGINPIDAVLQLLQKLTHGLTPAAADLELGGVIHNQEARNALLALLQHEGDFRKLLGSLDKVGPEMLQRDFETAFGSPITQVRLFDENLAQVTRLLGELLTPALTAVNDALHGLVDTIKFVGNTFSPPSGAHNPATGALSVLAVGADAKGFWSWLDKGVQAELSVAHAIERLLHGQPSDAANAPRIVEHVLELHVTADPGLKVTQPGGAPATQLRIAPPPDFVVQGRD